MKYLKKLSRNELKKVFGGNNSIELEPIDGGGGCESGHGCPCGAIYNNFTPGKPRWNCCECPRQGF